MKTKVLVIGLAALASGIALAVRAYRQINETRAAIAALAPQNAAARADIAQLELRLRTTKNELTRLKEKSSVNSGDGEVAGSATAERSETGTTPKTSAGKFSPETVIANDPQKLAVYSQNFRAGLDLAWGGMSKALHLSPEQLEKFKDLKLREELRWMELVAAAETQGLGRYEAGFYQLMLKHGNEARKEERRFFESEGLATEYLEWRELRYLRETTQRLASSEVYPTAPITSAQVERVTEILANNSAKPPSAWSRATAWSWPHWTTINWDAASAQLNTVLSPEQLATLRLLIRPQEAHTASTRRWVQLQAEARKLVGQQSH